MIPPQAMHAIGRVLLQIGVWAFGKSTSGALAGVDRDIARLLRLDERSLLEEIGRQSPVSRALPGREAIERGRATVERLGPAIRARLCPHRARIVSGLGAPEAELAMIVWRLLDPGVVSMAAKPVAVVIVKRGLDQVCRGWSPATAT